MCHGVDAGHSDAVQQLSEIIVHEVFQRCAAQKNAEFRIGLSVWELDGTGEKIDLLSKTNTFAITW